MPRQAEEWYRRGVALRARCCVTATCTQYGRRSRMVTRCDNCLLATRASRRVSCSCEKSAAVRRTDSGGETMAHIVSEFWQFLKVRKKWWLLPIIVVMVLVGALLVFAQGSALAPFIYTIF